MTRGSFFDPLACMGSYIGGPTRRLAWWGMDGRGRPPGAPIRGGRGDDGISEGGERDWYAERGTRTSSMYSVESSLSWGIG